MNITQNHTEQISLARRRHTPIHQCYPKRRVSPVARCQTSVGHLRTERQNSSVPDESQAVLSRLAAPLYGVSLLLYAWDMYRAVSKAYCDLAILFQKWMN